MSSESGNTGGRGLSSAGRQVVGGGDEQQRAASRGSTGSQQHGYRPQSRSTASTAEGKRNTGGEDTNTGNHQQQSPGKSAHFGDTQETYNNQQQSTSRNDEGNPFTLPSDEEVFKMREQEREQKQEQRKEQQRLKIWEKGAPQKEGMLRQLQKEAEPELDAATQERIKRTQNLVSAATEAIASSKKHQKENMTKFVEKKREMFLLQMSLDTKREEIQKLEHKAQMKEEALKKSELMLEEDAIRFDAFLKENDRMAHAAMKRAEEESRLKQQKVQEIKRLKYQIQALKGDNAKNEDLLREWESYKKFLDELTPQEWKDKQYAELKEKYEQERQERYEADLKRWEEYRDSKYQELKEEQEAERKQAIAAGRKYTPFNIEKRLEKQLEPKPKLEDYPIPEITEDDYEMYFTHPEQLLNIFSGMEEENLFLIQNNQEIEQQLDELKQQYEDTKNSMERQTTSLNDNMKNLKDKINNEEEKVEKLKNRVHHSHEEDSQAKLLDKLGERIKEVYEKCGGDLSSNPDRISMLTKLEGKLEDQLSQMDKMPQEYVLSKERELESERRERVRAERQQQQQEALEQRLQKSLQRAQAPVKKRSGKPVMARSAPIRKKKQQEKMDPELAQELEDLKFFM